MYHLQTVFRKFKKNLWFFIKGARLKTLPAILVPLAMSSAWAFYQTEVLNASILFFTVFSALFIQISTNLFNDGLDSKQGLDSPLRKGPVRLTQSGQADFSQTQILAFFSMAGAILFGLPLILRGGWPILLLGCLSLALSYLYTGSRFSLLKRGGSELFCFLFFGPAAVFGTYYLQTLSLRADLIYLAIPCGLWAVSLLLVNHLRDEEEDKAGGRKHFVTLYGRTHSLFFLLSLQAFIYLICFFWMSQGLKAGAFSFFIMPFSAIWLYFVCSTPPSKKYNLYLAICSLLYILFGLAWILGLLY